MSASLVGSEMCIRDSNDPPLPGSAASPSAMRSMCLHVCHWPVSWVAREPVSYTHLTLPTICSV
eukprot:10125681-Alexandrium_andersonii.AAC.1